MSSVYFETLKRGWCNNNFRFHRRRCTASTRLDGDFVKWNFELRQGHEAPCWVIGILWIKSKPMTIYSHPPLSLIFVDIVFLFNLGWWFLDWYRGAKARNWCIVCLCRSNTYLLKQSFLLFYKYFSFKSMIARIVKLIKSNLC